MLTELCSAHIYSVLVKKIIKSLELDRQIFVQYIYIFSRFKYSTEIVKQM